MRQDKLKEIRLANMLEVVRKQLDDLNCEYHSYGQTEKYNDFDGVVFALESVIRAVEGSETLKHVDNFDQIFQFGC